MKYYITDLCTGLSHMRPFVITTRTHCEVRGQLLRDIDFSMKTVPSEHLQLLRLKLASDSESFVVSYLVDPFNKTQRFDFGKNVLELTFMYAESMVCCPSFRIFRNKGHDM